VEVKAAVEAIDADASDASAENPMLARAEDLWERGAKIRALGVLRRAARKTPNDAAVHKALAARAEETGAWGEAVKAARRWALLESSSEARLALARLERATGHRERAVALIEGVIKDDPSSPDAKTLLGEMRGQKLALSQ
jgi:tetratricopeptide (TPR) repeat protein